MIHWSIEVFQPEFFTLFLVSLAALAIVFLVAYRMGFNSCLRQANDVLPDRFLDFEDGRMIAELFVKLPPH